MLDLWTSLKAYAYAHPVLVWLSVFGCIVIYLFLLPLLRQWSASRQQVAARESYAEDIRVARLKQGAALRAAVKIAQQEEAAGPEKPQKKPQKKLSPPPLSRPPPSAPSYRPPRPRFGRVQKGGG
jgi:hypothetical protein